MGLVSWQQGVSYIAIMPKREVIKIDTTAWQYEFFLPVNGHLKK